MLACLVAGGASGGCSAEEGDPDAAPAAQATSITCSGSAREACAAIEVPACHEARCNESSGRCEIVPSNGACDDGLFCTVDDHCDRGACVGAPNDCGLRAPTCKSVVCDETARSCTFDSQPNGVFCKGDLCAVATTCQDGECVGVPKECYFTEATDDCHVGKCNPKTGACEAIAANDGMRCTSNRCLVNPVCTNGECGGGTPLNCAVWGDDCNTAVCDAQKGCVREPIAAGTACGTKDACNTGQCDGAGVCVMVPKNEGGACSDGITCTANDTCKNGVCSGESAAPYQVFFRETFASNAQGWVTESPWEIGQARFSPGGGASCPDPATDHTDGTDNGVAGTVIGGLVGPKAQPLAYLESPTFHPVGNATLEFYYRLDVPPPPWGEATVEVWNGDDWVRVWERPWSYLVSTCPTPWNKMSIDISAHTNGATKIRFGIASHVDGPSFTGFTIDDLVVASGLCP